MRTSVEIYIYIYICYNIYLHMPSRLLYRYKIVIKTLLLVRRSHEQKTTMADSFATTPRSVSYRCFTAASGSSFAEEGCTHTNAYLKSL